MPANFPEIWSSRVRERITTQNVAPWLDGIPEIDGELQVNNMGDMSESNTIHVPISTFAVDVLVNNTTYPIPVQAYSDTESLLTLDKLQTKVTTLTDDQVIGASYNRIDTATRSHVVAITSKKYKKALHAMAPASNTSDTPVLIPTGAVVAGRKTLTYGDLIALKLAFDNMECPADGRRLVLCAEHWADLANAGGVNAQQLMNFKTGDPAPVLAGFEMYQYVVSPKYTTGGAKVAFDAALPAGAVNASVAFWTGNIGKKTGITKQYFKRAIDDPDTQTNRIAYRHYYINMPLQNKYIGAILAA